MDRFKKEQSYTIAQISSKEEDLFSPSTNTFV